MSTLEKTINLLNVLPENQLELIYNFIQFLTSQKETKELSNTESLDVIFKNIVGAVPNAGKSLEEYRAERIKERYETFN